MNYIITVIIALTVSIGGFFGIQALPDNSPEAFGAFGDPFISIQVATTSLTAGFILSSVDGVNNVWIENAGGGSDVWETISENAFIQPTTTIGLIVSASTTIAANFNVQDAFSASSTSAFSGLASFNNGFISAASSTISVGTFNVLTISGTVGTALDITAAAGVGAVGSAVNLTAGNGAASNNGGGMVFTAGEGGASSGRGGDLEFNAGVANAAAGNGGSIFFQAGANGGSGIDGRYSFADPSGSNGVLNFATLSANRTYAFPNWDGEFAVATSTLQVSGLHATSTTIGSIFEGHLSASSTLSVSGISTLAGVLSTASSTVDGTLTVTGLGLFEGGLTLETGDTLTINGDAITDLTGSGLTLSGTALVPDLTGGTGITFSNPTVSFDCSEVEGVGINCSGENITLDATGDWTGTLDLIEGASFLRSDAADTATGLITLEGGLTIQDGDNFIFSGDTLTDFQGDATISVVSNALRVIDVNCTNCLGQTEIADDYLLIAGDFATGLINFDAGFISISSSTVAANLNIQDHLSASSTVSIADVLTVDATATSSFAGPLQTTVLDIQSTTATSTFGNGLRIENGALQVEPLVSCDTIDTDASGNFLCGTDSGAGGDPNLLNVTIGGTLYDRASTTDNAMFFDDGFVSSASSTINSILRVTATTTLGDGSSGDVGFIFDGDTGTDGEFRWVVADDEFIVLNQLHIEVTGTPFTVHNTNDAADNEVLHLRGNTRATAADDDQAHIEFELTDSAGNEQEFVRLTWQGTDITNGSEDGNLHFEVMHDGSFIDALELHTTIAGQDTTIWNTGGENIDFLIKGDTDGDLFVLDASADNLGIGTSSPFAKLSVDGDGFFGGNLTSSNMTATGTLDVLGLSTLTGFISTASSTVNDILNVEGHLSASSTLSVASRATFDGIIDITGVSFFGGAIDASSTANFDGLTVFDNGFISSASSTIAGALTVTGTVTLDTVLAINQTALVAGTNITLSTNTLNVDDAFLVNDANDTTTGILTVGGIDLTSFGNRIDLDTDNDTSIRSSADDNIVFEILAADRIVWDTTSIRFNDTTLDMDFIIDGDTVTDLFFVNAGTDRVGIASSSPSSDFSVGDGTNQASSTFGGPAIFSDPTHTGTSSIDVQANEAGFGGAINLEHADGTTCHAIVINAAKTDVEVITITCPTVSIQP